MKTIILCGGQGTRLREETEFKPKPMVSIGNMPILMHIMMTYAHYGHKDFVLCLGYKSEMIKNYFLNLRGFTNDFSLDLSSQEIKYLNRSNNFDFKITFVETGVDTPSGDRIKMATKYIEDDDFMITYGDGVSNIDINKLINYHREQTNKHNILATISAVRPSSKYGKILFNEHNIVEQFSEKPVLDDYINGGFMVFNKEALNYINDGDMLEDSLIRKTQNQKLGLYKHDGFWHSMDTYKDVVDLNNLWNKSKPWAVWIK
jgi:glucose-1-phosphate cytidylyltransferase